MTKKPKVCSLEFAKKLKVGQEISIRGKNSLNEFKCVFRGWKGDVLQFDTLPRNKEQEKRIGNGQYGWVAIDAVHGTGWAENDNLIIK